MLATQNPIEQEGTYPLPEAQLDRFMFNIFVDYPSEDEEFEIVKRTTADLSVEVTPTLSGRARSSQLQQIVRRVPVADHVVRYALRLARLTRPRQGRRARSSSATTSAGAPARGRASTWSWGRRPGRCCTGRFYAGCDDIRAVAYPVLRHRILTNFNAEAEGIKPDDIIRRLIETVDAEDRPRAPPVENSPNYLDPAAFWPGLRGWSCGPGGSSRATSPACTAAPTTASPSSLPSTASTPPATTSATSTGRSSAAPTSST